MIIGIELTLNRFGFGRISENKFQFLYFGFSKWKIVNKYSISFEINWRIKEKLNQIENIKFLSFNKSLEFLKKEPDLYENY